MFKKLNLISTKLIVFSIVFILIAFSIFSYIAIKTQMNISEKEAVTSSKLIATSMLSGLNEMMLNGTIMKKSDRKAIFSLLSKTKGNHNDRPFLVKTFDGFFVPYSSESNVRAYIWDNRNIINAELKRKREKAENEKKRMAQKKRIRREN